MLNDEIVDEVRQTRENHAARFNFDLWAIYADLKKSQDARVAAGHPCVSPPSAAPNTGFRRVHVSVRR